MIDLNNLKILRPKKPYNRLHALKSNITIRFHINNKYECLTVTFGELVYEKFSINKGDRLELACDKNDNLIWYLIIKNNSEGYKIFPAPRSGSLKSIIRDPFLNAKPTKKCQLNIDDITYYKKERILMLSVHDFFDNKQLTFKEDFISK